MKKFISKTFLLLSILHVCTCRGDVKARGYVPEMKAVGYTPPSIIAGTSTGVIERCRFDNVNECTKLHTVDHPVLAIAVAGEFIYAGLDSGEMVRCKLHETEKCTSFHKSESAFNALAIIDTNIYAGTDKGIIYRCGLRKSEECKTFYETPEGVHALTGFEENLYVGSDKTLLFCPLDKSNTCIDFVSTDSKITSLNYDANFIYAGQEDGKVLRCDANSENCTDLFTAHSEIHSLDVFDGYVQSALSAGDILRYHLGKNVSLTFNKSGGPARAITSIYATGKLTHHYAGENNNCTWQFMDCPPFVNYYDVESRVSLKLHVKDGLVYNSIGERFDTSQADRGHTGRKAIFVMDPTGRVFASNVHPILLLHHSSLMAGNPTAAAGELEVRDGIIKSASSCSGHYRQSVELTKQLISAFRRQGYEKNFDVLDCRHMRLMIDLDYNKLPLYYEEVMNETLSRPTHEWEKEGFLI